MGFLSAENNPKCPLCHITVIKWHHAVVKGEIQKMCRACKRKYIKDLRDLGVEYNTGAVEILIAKNRVQSTQPTDLEKPIISKAGQ